MLVSDTALADTGFWIALFDARDAQHKTVGGQEELFELLTLIVPWPTLYETLRTRFVRRSDWVGRLDRILKRPNVEFVDDTHFREEAYALTVEYSTRLRRFISMVDMMCRLLIEDSKIRIDYLLTTNPEDFADLCGKYQITILR
jgi:predicted nucleic acid-binding protein